MCSDFGLGLESLQNSRYREVGKAANTANDAELQVLLNIRKKV
jgi:hypothetical protein